MRWFAGMTVRDRGHTLAMMPGGSVRIGRLAGIPIGINPLWLVIVALITWSLGAAYYPDQVSGIAPAAAYGLGFASALLLFASILLHELGHAVVARRRGVAVEGIDLWLLGGVSKLRGSPHGPDDELRYAAAGPAVTLAIAIGFGGIVLALPAGTPAGVRALLEYQLYVNALILGFNLLPAFPLDGGRILRAAIWGRVGDMARATSMAAMVGRGFAYGFIFLGLLAALQGAPGGLWLSLIGLFIALAGRAEEGSQQLRSTLGGHEARELMAFPAVVIPAELTIREALGAFARYRYRSFPVFDGDQVLGLLTIDRVEAQDRAAWDSTLVRDLVETDPALFIDESADVAELLERPAFQRLGRAIVRTNRGAVGILSISEVQRAVRTLRLRPDAAGTALPNAR
jgi:Zn-dependent protease/predicted transcriptional regulator